MATTISLDLLTERGGWAKYKSQTERKRKKGDMHRERAI
jgi:hypothetical protein